MLKDIPKAASPPATSKSKEEPKDLTFSITYRQILDVQGKLTGESEPELSEEQLIHLYTSMSFARVADDRMLKMQRQGRIGTFPPCTGQEACVCGPALAMTKQDWFLGAFRELGGRLMRGEPLENSLRVYNGWEDGNTFEGGDRTLPVSIIISAQALHSVGIAYAMRMKGEKDSAVVCFFGDGGTSQGDFHEALNFAATWQVPAVFICQNNQWAISVPRSKQTHSRTLAQKAIAYDMPGIQVDGNDPLAMYQVTKEALERAKSGGGPTFIEAVTYRMRMHTTADDPKRYQVEDELKVWEKRDPLIRFRVYLENKGIWDEKKQQALDEDVKKRVDEAVKKFEAWEDAKPDSPFDYIFGTKHSRIEEQRAEFLDALAKESDNA